MCDDEDSFAVKDVLGDEVVPVGDDSFDCVLQAFSERQAVFRDVPVPPVLGGVSLVIEVQRRRRDGVGSRLWAGSVILVPSPDLDLLFTMLGGSL